MAIDDAVLPAAAHLTGPDGRAVLQAAATAAGGGVRAARLSHVQYRPGHDVVVRFEAAVAWGDREPTAETLLAATTAAGPPPGTLAVEAATPDGRPLAVGVWRWPFDPFVTGLADAVTPAPASELLAGLAGPGPVTLDVVAYRPTERAVVRATGTDGEVVYMKAVRPEALSALVERHERLLAAGAPVPAVLRADPDRGLVVLAALRGPTVRDLLKSDMPGWPDPQEYERVHAAFHDADLAGMPAVEGRLATAPLHAEMLAGVLPGERARLDRLAAVVRAEAARVARPPVAIHGDLYEAQLITSRHDGAARITGVLDVDDAGPGDPLDDRASVIAHLLVRALDAPAPQRRRLQTYAAALRRRFGGAVDRRDLDVVTAAAVVGLATGPFRVQQHDWARAVPRHLALADDLVRHAGEEELRSASSPAHVAARQGTQPNVERTES